MKNFAPLFLLGLGLFTGCANHYVITLTNGTQIGAQGKPKYSDGAYHFKDADGREKAVSAGRVKQIAPESSSQQSKKFEYLDSGK